MSEALAGRLRDYLDGRRKVVEFTLLGGHAQNMEDYHAGCARLEEFKNISEQIGEIMKDINSVGSG